ncbi:MAG: 3-dehydroquinate synthase [Rhodanobacteraceae bacterium]|nr:3-dehydroquinate synthase [Rhodanobacteraceae bacterium]
MSGSSEFDIHSSTKSYRVVVGTDIARARMEASSSILICDEILPARYPWLQREPCIRIQAREEFKTLDTVGLLVEQLRKHGATRGTRVIAAGGGIVQDVATFATSCYMRGIGWDYVPTTLLGMVDSCIGGKSSINVGTYKNIAGNFYPPDAVWVDTQFCSTLSPAQMVEGLCEAVKICYASTNDAFDQYLALAASGNLLRDQAMVARIIGLTLATKKVFIEADEFDNGIRLLLNFGHTFGHALEGASGYRISHGVAVGLGMLASLSFSEAQGLTDRSCARVSRLHAHLRWLLAQVPGLDAELTRIPANDLLRCFDSDKKHTAERYAIIAYDAEGFLIRHSVPRTAATEQALRQAFAAVERELNEI